MIEAQESTPLQVFGFVLGVLLVTLYRATSSDVGFMAYWRERAAEAASAGIMALVLSFLWWHGYLQLMINSSLEAVFRPEPGDQGFANLRVTFSTSLAAGAFLDWTGIKLARWVLAKIPGQKNEGRLPK